MPDYKSMYYYLAGWTANAVDILETVTSTLDANAEALTVLKEKLKLAHQTTEDLFINGRYSGLDEDDKEQKKPE